MRSRTIVRLYPRAWRERYGDEFEELVGSRPLKPRMLLDILVGALDARLAPQAQFAASAKGPTAAGGRVMEILRSGCCSPSIPAGVQLRTSLLAAGATIGLALVFVGLKRTVGETVWVTALGSTVICFGPLAYLPVYLHKHSSRARWLFATGLLALCYAIGLLAAWT